MPIKIGLAPEDLRPNTLFLTVTQESPIEAKILVDIDHVIQGEFCHHKVDGKELVWTYIGEEDPCYDLESKPRFSVIVPCLIKERDKKVVRYIRGPRQFNRELLKLDATYETIRGLIVKFVREDGDWAKYSIVPSGKVSTVSEDQDEVVSDFLNEIFQGNAEQIRQYISDNGASIKAKINTSDFEETEL